MVLPLKYGTFKRCKNYKWVRYLKAALFKNLVNKLRILTIFRLSIFSIALFLTAQLFSQHGKLSEFKGYLPKS